MSETKWFAVVTHEHLGQPSDPGESGRDIFVEGHEWPFHWSQRTFNTLRVGDFEGIFMFLLNRDPSAARRYELVGNSYLSCG